MKRASDPFTPRSLQKEVSPATGLFSKCPNRHTPPRSVRDKKKINNTREELTDDCHDDGAGKEQSQEQVVHQPHRPRRRHSVVVVRQRRIARLHCYYSRPIPNDSGEKRDEKKKQTSTKNWRRRGNLRRAGRCTVSAAISATTAPHWLRPPRLSGAKTRQKKTSWTLPTGDRKVAPCCSAALAQVAGTAPPSPPRPGRRDRHSLAETKKDRIERREAWRSLLPAGDSRSATTAHLPIISLGFLMVF